MIDGVKLSCDSGNDLLEGLKRSKYSSGILMSNKLQDNSDTGYRYLNKNGLDFRIGIKKNHIKGSLHKWFNTENNLGEQNHTDFTYSQLVSAIDTLISITGVNHLKISRLEVGVNIDSDLNLKRVINNGFLFYKKRTHNSLENFNGSGLLKRFKTSKYDFKIYDKGLQYALDGDLNTSKLRLEIVYKTSSELRKLGIGCLTDLKCKSTLRRIFADLLKKFNDFVIVDDFSSITYESDECYIYKCTNPNYWEVYFEGKSSSYKHRLFRKFKKKLSELGLDSTKQFLTKELKKKYAFIMNR